MWSDRANHHELLGLREFCAWVNLTSLIQQVWVPIWRVITLLWGLPNPIEQVVPLTCHIRLYPPHHFHLHPPPLTFSSTTLPSSQNTTFSHPSLSLHAMIMSCHRVQHTPTTVYTEYSIHWLQYTPMIVGLPFVFRITSTPLNVRSASGVPPYTIDPHWPACHESSKVKSPCHIPTFASQLTDKYSLSTRPRTVHRQPSSTHLISLDHGIQSVSLDSL